MCVKPDIQAVMILCLGGGGVGVCGEKGEGGEVWFFIDQRGHAALIGTCNCNANKKQENMAEDYTFSISLVNNVHVYKIYIVIHTSDREQKGIDICNLIFFLSHFWGVRIPLTSYYLRDTFLWQSPITCPCIKLAWQKKTNRLFKKDYIKNLNFPGNFNRYIHNGVVYGWKSFAATFTTFKLINHIIFIIQWQ